MAEEVVFFLGTKGEGAYAELCKLGMFTVCQQTGNLHCLIGLCTSNSLVINGRIRLPNASL